MPTSARQWFTPSRPRELTAVLGILARPRPSAASYCHCDDASDALSCLHEVPVAQVRVARRGPVSAMPEESADERQTFARHNGLTGGGMSQVMQPEPAEHCIGTNRPPAGCKAVGAPAFGVERGHERIGVRAPGSAAVCARAASPSGTVCGTGLGVGQIDGVAADVAPAQIEHFAAAASSMRQQLDGGDGLGPSGLVSVERAAEPRQLVRVKEPGDVGLRVLLDAETGVGVALAQAPVSARNIIERSISKALLAAPGLFLLAASNQDAASSGPIRSSRVLPWAGRMRTLRYMRTVLRPEDFQCGPQLCQVNRLSSEISANSR